MREGLLHNLVILYSAVSCLLLCAHAVHTSLYCMNRKSGALELLQLEHQSFHDG